MKRLLCLTPLLLLLGCGSKEHLPFLGRWHADFVVDQINPSGTQQDRKREALHGYLQVYQTGQTFKMHLEGEQEALDADGTWAVAGKRFTMKVTGLKIDDNGGANHRDPNLKFIPASDLHSAYQRELIFNLSPDKQRLTGLDMTVGNLIGRHVCTRSTD